MATEEKGRPRLKKIRSGALSRGFALARVSLAAGARAATHAVSDAFGSAAESDSRRMSMLMDQVTLLARELGKLKGSVMKAGQMLSLMGDHFLPPEVNAILKTLQSDSPPVEWREMEKVLRRQLPPEKLAELEIDPEPMAAASLGQVHRARRKSDGRVMALKIQYPGVEAAIEGDLRTLKGVLTVSKLIPSGPRYDTIFEEVRSMLHHEVDYARELENTTAFRGFYADAPEIIVPEVFPEYSGGRVLATSLEAGEPVDSPKVKALSQERRDRLGYLVLTCYFREIFRLHQVQTDPHFGNYRIQIDPEGENDRLVMLDFGAVRKFPAKFVEPYTRLVRASLLADRESVWAAARELGFLQVGDPAEVLESFFQVCLLFVEPFPTTGAYDWGTSDLPRRVTREGALLAVAMRLRPPPKEVVFLDRRAGGVFFFLSSLGARVAAREILLSHVSLP